MGTLTEEAIRTEITVDVVVTTHAEAGVTVADLSLARADRDRRQRLAVRLARA